MKLLNSCVIALAIALTPSLGLAQAYACQYIASAGLIWSNGSWEPARFKSGLPFFLQLKGGTLTVDSAATALDSPMQNVTCTLSVKKGSPYTVHTCSTVLGALLVFIHETQNGGISRILGSAQATGDQQKDTLSVNPFTCQNVIQ